MQPDMFIEAEDRKVFAGVTELKPFLDNLPQNPYITPGDICLCFDRIFSNNGKSFSVSNVYRWIDSGAVTVLPVQSGEEGKKRRYMILRSSFLNFLKSRINAI